MKHSKSSIGLQFGLVAVMALGCSDSSQEEKIDVPWFGSPSSEAVWPEMKVALLDLKVSSMELALKEAVTNKASFACFLEERSGAIESNFGKGGWICGSNSAVAFWSESQGEKIPNQVTVFLRHEDDWEGIVLKKGSEPWIVDSGSSAIEVTNKIGLLYLSRIDPLSEIYSLISEGYPMSLEARGELAVLEIGIPNETIIFSEATRINRCRISFDQGTGLPKAVIWFHDDHRVKEVLFRDFVFDSQLTPQRFNSSRWDF